ncbi:BREX-1 system adenine-specific DNA-methyltransferase PglX [Candidatus Thiodictyon syntrophicum]|nr:BREX-1 system adenine-specific DNA-methyltransferase PglX [Candidatus Thiodictyon syntrophicum]
MLNPETITVLDPACGSGHILVVAYDVLKAIYLERGYRPRDIPRLILEKNLYGLDIDDRAAQLAGFALLMKARADDRRLLNDPPRLNVLALQESKGLNADELTRSLQPIGAMVGRANPAGVTRQQAAGFAQDDLFPDTLPQMNLGESVAPDASGNAALTRSTIAALIDTFAEAKTFGSLIPIPPALAKVLPEMESGLLQALDSGDVFAWAAAEGLLPLVRQARVLAMRFDAVVANPPYMGGKGMNAALKDYAKNVFPDSKSDLFSMFIERGFDWCRSCGFNSMVTMQSWMFLSSFEAMREKILQRRTVVTMAHLGARAFGEISGEVVQTTAFSLQICHFNGFKPVFFRLVDGQEEKKAMALRAGQNRFDNAIQDDFKIIPGSPVAYWVSEKLKQSFASYPALSDIGKPRQGLATMDNERFLRLWHECSISNTLFDAISAEEAFSSRRRWFPCQKGGAFRKWYGNHEYLVDWEDNGERIKALAVARYGSASKRVVNEALYFKPGITWSTISGGLFSMRYVPAGFIFETKGAMCFFDREDILKRVLGFCNSAIVSQILKCISPTLDFHEGPVGKVPVAEIESEVLRSGVSQCVRIAKNDWDAAECSWGFQSFPWIRSGAHNPPANSNARKQFGSRLENDWETWEANTAFQIAQIREIEGENNRIFIEAYGLQDELSPEVPEDQITLARADREKDCQRLISYAIGCMMGRYRLDRPGLIYAHSGNQDFEAIYNVVREKSTDDTDEHRSRNDYLCSSVSSVDNSSSPAANGITDAVREKSTDDTDEHRSRNDYLCSSVSSVDNSSSPAADGITDATREKSTDDTDEHRSRNDYLCSSVSSVDNSSSPAADGITDATREKSTDDTDEHRSRNDYLCSSVSSVDNSSFPAPDGITDATREKSTDDTDEHRSGNEHLCSSVSSVDKNPFPPDADGIVPITDANWFDDDASNRIREFLLAVWGTETLNENMAWLAESLGPKSGETPDETIRRYLSASFFKDHLQTYKRRPIYWCFSSGKQKAFEALVYLHRYHEGTLARMRMEYVVPLQGKMAARIDRLADDIASASTTAQAKRLQKERDKLTRQLDELRRYDEQLRHYADQRIALDLDDGVKANYAKFGDLLAEVKAVTGQKESTD